MGDTKSDMDIEVEQKENKINFLADKIEIPDSKVVEEINRLDLKDISSKGKSDRLIIMLNKTLNNTK